MRNLELFFASLQQWLLEVLFSKKEEGGKEGFVDIIFLKLSSYMRKI